MSIRETFSNTTSLPVTNEYDEGGVYDESVTSKIQNLRSSFFYSKCLKFKLDFKNASKNSEKAFCF